MIGFELLRGRLRGGFCFCITTHKEAAKVAPDGSRLVGCVVIACEAHAMTCLATTVALVVGPRERRPHHHPARDRYKTGILTVTDWSQSNQRRMVYRMSPWLDRRSFNLRHVIVRD